MGCSEDDRYRVGIDTVVATEVCCTPTPPPPTWFFEPDSRSLSNRKHYKLNVYVHVVRFSYGAGLNKDIVSTTIIDNLNRDYLGTNISFCLFGSDYIDDSDLNRLPSQLVGTLFRKNRKVNSINIYVLTAGADFNSQGKAESIPSISCVIKGNSYKTNVVSHIIGHCLGLYHTHHGTSIDERSSNSLPELVDGTNSTTCGDFISDTPADPNIWNGCVYIGTLKDANGDSYSPSAVNIMSYASCRSEFTSLQNERMLDTIEKNAEIKATINLLPDVLVSCLVPKCTFPMEVFITSPNSAHISNDTPNGNSTGSTQLIRPLFVTSDDKFYVEAVIKHACTGRHTLRISNGYSYAETINFNGGTYNYSGYIPLAHMNQTEQISFQVTPNKE